MQTIETRYIGPRNVRGSRVKAIASGGFSLTIEWEDALGSEDNHDAAALALVKKLGWYHGIEPGDTYGDWYKGSLKDGGYVYVCCVGYAKLNTSRLGAAR